MTQFFNSARIAINNIRANPLHTLLSTLGIIIGVAALVGILALGDGLEKAARDQLSKTTSVQSFTISSNARVMRNGISVAVQNRPKLNYEHARYIEAKYAEQADVEYVAMRTIEATVQDSSVGIFLHGSMENAPLIIPDFELKLGRMFSREEVDTGAKLMLVNQHFMKNMPDSTKVIGERVSINAVKYSIIGVIDLPMESPRALIPITTFDANNSAYPSLTMKVDNVEQIPLIEEEIKSWLDDEFEQGADAFSLIKDDYWVDQLSEGILLFKLVMGAITGISVLVGGIGIMNVLLISVTERTKEIGIRKATGAKSKDIVMQFMSESITISMVGSILGWMVGMLGVLIFVPLVNSLVNIEFSVVVNPLSVLIVLVLAVIIGVTFGTYPAWRASRLDPIDAIRHE
ncbi:MAG: ABC transporter permease [Balneolaceae bacterium]|nr:ABC transporter permease [Balneolaceae bacterium]